VKEAVNPTLAGTKAPAHYELTLVPARPSLSAYGGQSDFTGQNAFAAFDKTFALRRREAESFMTRFIRRIFLRMRRRQCGKVLPDALVQAVLSLRDSRNGCTGPGPSSPTRGTSQRRNREWTHLYNADVISMPDKWDTRGTPRGTSRSTAFRSRLVDSDFAKEQLTLTAAVSGICSQRGKFPRMSGHLRP